MKYILMISLFLVGCVGPSQQELTTSNKDVNVKLLFEVEGCKVYRFYDGVISTTPHYFTNCSETISTINCGKNCYRQENIGKGK